jgi:site-specific DNA-methyltransferase (adenine-specific)
MSHSKQSKQYQIFNEDSINLKKLDADSIDALVTDPPYGISYQNNEWDKALPDIKIWKECFRTLKPGSFGLVFSSVRLMHRLMVNLEDCGFEIKDVLFWSYLNGMPKSRNIGIDIDKELGVESQQIGEYKYVQGYKKDGANSYLQNESKKILSAKSELGQKYNGSGLNLKPAYEPIIMIQKPIGNKLSIAQNVINYGTGVLNFEQTRIPYDSTDSKVGHNPHPVGRTPSNIIRIQEHGDGYDKFFQVAKVRQSKDTFNFHPTLKPVELMSHLVKLVCFEGQSILDPFMGSGSTGVACQIENRKFIGFELEKKYFEITQRRLQEKSKILDSVLF